MPPSSNQMFRAKTENLRGILDPDQLILRVFISLQYKYIYVSVPKAACSTTKNYLASCELGSQVTYLNFEDVHDRILSPLLSPTQIMHLFPEILSDKSFYKFTFVRNPYHRILSAYKDKIINHKSYRYQVIKHIQNDPLTDRPISFEEFVRTIYNCADHEMNTHWMPQHHLIMDHAIQYDHIGKVETYQNDILEISKSIGLKFKFLHQETRNESNSERYLKECYTDDLCRMVKIKYREDFLRLSYSKVPTW